MHKIVSMLTSDIWIVTLDCWVVAFFDSVSINVKHQPALANAEVAVVELRHICMGKTLKHGNDLNIIIMVCNERKTLRRSSFFEKNSSPEVRACQMKRMQW